VKSFPFVKQYDQMDCGPTCLQMIAQFYGKSYSLQYLREQSFLTKTGASLFGVSEAAEKIGFRATGAHVSFEQLSKIPLPCIAHWQQDHFIVIYKVEKNKISIADPAHGLIKLNKQDFEIGWKSNAHEQGVVLILEPTPIFYENPGVAKTEKSYSYFLNYLRPYKPMIIQLLLGLIVAAIFDLFMPFLTQAIVDYGINYQNVHFIYIVILAQVFLFLSRITVELIRSRILLHIGARVNIAIIADYLNKIMYLPITFFDSKLMGDFTQRINDHKRIESFLTAQTLNILFSMFSLVVFSGILIWYNYKIFAVFFIGSILGIIWILLFQKKRKELDYLSFNRTAENQSNIFEFFTGVNEIKLNNLYLKKRWQWEEIQAKLYKVRMKSLNLAQLQGIGTSFINQTKNILITLITALEVINGSISLGIMMAIMYIVGQLNSPIERLIDFIRSAQDAKISFERLNEVQSLEPEDANTSTLETSIIDGSDIVLKNVSFSYEGPNAPLILENLNITIPGGKTTAIVGTSGSGKTTLLKLLLKFYKPSHGNIEIGGANLSNITASFWRSKCGVVMQDGYLFTDSITKNIIGNDEKINAEKINNAVRLANMEHTINKLPLGFTTKIGAGGQGLSIGQKQRLLIARAVYKDPAYLLFDEATSSLDANNEKVIMQNLQAFSQTKTTIVIAHRLSTVKNADLIIVLEDGKIVETGNHQHLTSQQGKYYELVKNQLELGS
jgi:ATP-binding cassette subfamily B protein